MDSSICFELYRYKAVRKLFICKNKYSRRKK